MIALQCLLAVVIVDAIGVLLGITLEIFTGRPVRFPTKRGCVKRQLGGR